MKKILLITVATLGMSFAAQATALPLLAAPSASRPLAGLYPLINRQAPANIGRVGSSLFTGALNLPGLGTLTLGRLVGK